MSRNKKGGRDNLTKEFGRYDFTLRDIINIEKIILRNITPSDFYVEIKGGKKFSSARYIPESDTEVSYLYMKSQAPNVSIEISPRKITLSVQRMYSKNEKLDSLNKIADLVTEYFEGFEPKRITIARNRVHLIKKDSCNRGRT